MPITLVAKFVYTNFNGQVAMVGFADDQFDTKNYILLQRALHPDNSDVELGHDAIHVTISDQNCSGYGGVKRFVLGESEARLYLSTYFAIELNTDEEHVILLEDPQLDSQDLQNCLKKLFDNNPECLELE